MGVGTPSLSCLKSINHPFECVFFPFFNSPTAISHSSYGLPAPFFIIFFDFQRVIPCLSTAHSVFFHRRLTPSYGLMALSRRHSRAVFTAVFSPSYGSFCDFLRLKLCLPTACCPLPTGRIVLFWRYNITVHTPVFRPPTGHSVSSHGSMSTFLRAKLALKQGHCTSPLIRWKKALQPGNAL